MQWLFISRLLRYGKTWRIIFPMHYCGSASGIGGDTVIKGKSGPKSDLTEKEKKLIQLIRDTNFGEVRIIVQDKEPIRVEEVKKSIKL